MKLIYTTADGRLTVELEAANDKDLFRKLAHFQEIYEDIPAGKVDGKVVTGGNVRYRVRKSQYTDEKGKNKEAEYFEKIVVDGPLAWYKKAYGVLDDGSDNLFPKRNVDEDPKVTVGLNGWHKYNTNV